MDCRKVFQGKRVTLMGLGLLGRGVGDAAFLASQGAELVVTDLKSEEQLAESIVKLKQFTSITYRLGGHNLEDFRDCDYVLKAAGVPLDSVYIEEARKNKIPIKMSASWFAEISGIPTVGVTGTRGKTTTTMMLNDIMKLSGMNVLLGGNVRGVSTLALLPQVTQQSIALMELDSWQCQGWGEAKMSPNVAVFTTFMDDHLNYYKGDLHKYFNDKAQIFLNQTPNDTLIMSSQVAERVEVWKYKVPSRVVLVDAKKFPNGWSLKVPGEHNMLNASCALEAARALGIDDEASKNALESFGGVEGRLQLLREINGIKIYNDNNSTTPDAAIAALNALGTTRTILIMGGADKGLDMSKLEARLLELKKVVRIEQGMQEAVREAFSHAVSGDIILFSPAYASFGMFKNEYERNDQFVKLVAALV